LLADADLKRFFRAIQDCGDVQHEILLKLLFYTAVRVSELVHIEVGDVDLDACKIFIERGNRCLCVCQRKKRCQYLTTAVAVYPFEETGIGPNAHNFDPNVLYQIHVATKGDLATGDATYSYRFHFSSAYKNANTIAQSYLGVINSVDDANQNLTQTYDVTMVKQEWFGQGLEVCPAQPNKPQAERH
jgi:hypothetical protein